MYPGISALSAVLEIVLLSERMAGLFVQYIQAPVGMEGHLQECILHDAPACAAYRRRRRYTGFFLRPEVINPVPQRRDIFHLQMKRDPLRHLPERYVLEIPDQRSCRLPFDLRCRHGFSLRIPYRYPFIPASVRKVSSNGHYLGPGERTGIEYGQNRFHGPDVPVIDTPLDVGHAAPHDTLRNDTGLIETVNHVLFHLVNARSAYGVVRMILKEIAPGKINGGPHIGSAGHPSCR